VDIYFLGMQRRVPIGASREARSPLGGTDALEGLGSDERYLARVVSTAREARAFVLAMPLNDDLKERAMLVVSELATNAIVHGGGVLYLQFLRRAGCVRVEVADASPKLPGRVKVNLTSGRGLQMVDVLASAWGAELQPWGKVVWAELD
jgi:anti-sigma regulatory factor (Ser/Thr protein kinase)